jgi:early secretory antigenic target protein ESAT-6
MPGQDGHILVTFGALSQAQADVNQVHQQLNQTVSDVRRYLADLMANWEGSAAGNYQAYQNVWNGIADDHNATLHAIGGCVAQALENYVRAEQANASMWG